MPAPMAPGASPAPLKSGRKPPPQAAAENAWAALKKDFSGFQLILVVPEQAESWSQEACPALPNPLGQGPAEAWIPCGSEVGFQGPSQGPGGCPLVVPYRMTGVLE